MCSRIFRPSSPRAPCWCRGIADAVLVNGGEAEIVDYKTDRGKTPAALVESYARQLRIYKGRGGKTPWRCRES